jgi:beta-glucosidase
MNNKISAIRPDFIWGVSTSSYQIEGAAHEDGRGPSIWDTFSRIEGKVTNGDTGDVACDHYHRYAEDVALMRDMGLDAYRFSVAWPRVLPQGRGSVNEPGLAFYDRLIDALLAAGIEPWLCFYHWDLPQALEDLGGWTARDSAGWFADYADVVARAYGDRVKRFATFNEPSVFSLLGFAFGAHAPGLTSREALLKVIHNVNRAHGRAIDAVRAAVSASSVGAVHNVQPCRPASTSPADRDAALTFDQYWNNAFPDPQLIGRYPPLLAQAMADLAAPGDMAEICRPVDWFGLNHYSPIYTQADANSVIGCGFGPAPADVQRTSMGWPIEPDAFRETLLLLDRTYGLPVYVLENGTATTDVVFETGEAPDPGRIDYLRMYIEAMQKAIAAGADVRGYFVWSLLDNFEWNAGYGQRFGLVRVDYKTLKRTPKSSVRWYADMIKAGRATQAASAAPVTVPGRK